VNLCAVLASLALTLGVGLSPCQLSAQAQTVPDLLEQYRVQYAAVKIPSYSLRYRAVIERAGSENFGLDSPTARLAAQIHQESAWQPHAASAYAQGLAQFTPATAQWLPRVCPQVGAPDPWDAGWAIRAMACYDAWLYAQAPGADECHKWAFVLADYNGGQGMRQREQKLAVKAGANADAWWFAVENFRVRAPAAYVENRAYVRRILLILEPAYLAAGWDDIGACS